MVGVVLGANIAVGVGVTMSVGTGNIWIGIILGIIIGAIFGGIFISQKNSNSESE